MTMTTLTETQTAVLQAAADEPLGRIVWFPESVKGGARINPTSATRAKKASNLLILRSWGRKGRHYKVMLWLGHEGGIGGDLGG